MKMRLNQTFALVFLSLLAATASAQEATSTDAAAEAEAPALSVLDRWSEDPLQVFDVNEANLTDFRWIARPIVVFADSPLDPNFRQQMDLLAAGADDLAERDVIILVDTDPEARSAWRTDLRPRGFALVLIGKDGSVKLRKPLPWDVRELSRTIDKMPLRQQEIEDRRGQG